MPENESMWKHVKAALCGWLGIVGTVGTFGSTIWFGVRKLYEAVDVVSNIQTLKSIAEWLSKDEQKHMLGSILSSQLTPVVIFCVAVGLILLQGYLNSRRHATTAEEPKNEVSKTPAATTITVRSEASTATFPSGRDALRDGVLKVKAAWEWFEEVGRPPNEETLATVGNATYALRDALDKTPLPPFSRQLLREGVDVMLTAHRKRLLALKTPSERPTAIFESWQALDKLRATDTGYFDRLIAHVDALGGITPITPVLRKEFDRLLGNAFNAGLEAGGNRKDTKVLSRVDAAYNDLNHHFETHRTVIGDAILSQHLDRCIAFLDLIRHALRRTAERTAADSAADAATLADECQLGDAWPKFVDERQKAIDRMREICPVMEMDETPAPVTSTVDKGDDATSELSERAAELLDVVEPNGILGLHEDEPLRNATDQRSVAGKPRSIVSVPSPVLDEGGKLLADGELATVLDVSTVTAEQADRIYAAACELRRWATQHASYFEPGIRKELQDAWGLLLSIIAAVQDVRDAQQAGESVQAALRRYYRVQGEYMTLRKQIDDEFYKLRGQ